VDPALIEYLPLAANILLALCVIGGVIGSVVPGVPGASIVCLGVILHGLMTGWDPLGLWTQLSILVLLLLSIASQFLIAALGAKQSGATKWGPWERCWA